MLKSWFFVHQKGYANKDNQVSQLQKYILKVWKEI